jgi:hypothetical protein
MCSYSCDGILVGGCPCPQVPDPLPPRPPVPDLLSALNHQIVVTAFKERLMDSFGAGKTRIKSSQAMMQSIPAESTTISADFVFLARAERHAAPRNPLQCSVLADKCAGCQTGNCGKQLTPVSVLILYSWLGWPPPVIQVRQHIWMEGCLWKQRNTGHTQHDDTVVCCKGFALQSSQVVAYNSDTESQEVLHQPRLQIHSTSIQTSSQGQSHWLPAKQVESPGQSSQVRSIIGFLPSSRISLDSHPGIGVISFMAYPIHSTHTILSGQHPPRR